MDYQDQILSFLEKPENLPIALEVAKHVEALRPRLHKAFWGAIGQSIKMRLEKSSFEGRWAISNSGSFDQAWRNFQIHVKPIPETFKGSYLTVCLMQHERQANYQLRYGLCWSRKERSAPDSQIFRSLLELSKLDGFPEKSQDSWWPVFKMLGIFLNSDDFMLQYGLNPAGFIEELTERIWAYFTRLEPALYQLNQELFEGKA